MTALKQFTESFLFLFTFEKIKYSSDLAASSRFAVTGRRIIIYTGN